MRTQIKIQTVRGLVRNTCGLHSLSGATTVEKALALGDKMLAEGLIYHVPTMFQPLATDLSYHARNFQNDTEFYRFAVSTAGSRFASRLARRSSGNSIPDMTK
eukprot:7480518-Pyramimonas_sp.AAC.1